MAPYEVIIGATVTMQEEGNENGEVLTTATDEFGDFWFRQVEGKKYHLWFEAEDQGFVTCELADVEYEDLDLQPCNALFSGRVAQAIQHEIDHCDGVLI